MNLILISKTLNGRSVQMSAVPTCTYLCTRTGTSIYQQYLRNYELTVTGTLIYDIIFVYVYLYLPVSYISFVYFLTYDFR